MGVNLYQLSHSDTYRDQLPFAVRYEFERWCDGPDVPADDDREYDETAVEEVGLWLAGIDTTDDPELREEIADMLAAIDAWMKGEDY